jgi:putative FmdB family regulatory protein
MPIYCYICANCGHSFEKLEKIDNRKDPEDSPCENCGMLSIKLSIAGQPPLIDPFRLGRLKHNDDFRESMRNIKRNNPGANMKDY